MDFREQQCILYNNQSFRGTIYSWEAYILGDFFRIKTFDILASTLFIFSDEAECELNCKPIGMEYFATLEDRVVDGTSCYSPVDFVKRNTSGRALCVEGICKVRNGLS